MTTVASGGPTIAESETSSVQAFSRSFDAFGDPVAIVDSEAHVVYANKMLEHTTGYSWKEIQGKSPLELWGGKMSQAFYDRLWHTIRVEKKPFVGEVQAAKKDGTTYWKGTARDADK